MLFSSFVIVYMYFKSPVASIFHQRASRSDLPWVVAWGLSLPPQACIASRPKILKCQEVNNSTKEWKGLMDKELSFQQLHPLFGKTLMLCSILCHLVGLCSTYTRSLKNVLSILLLPFAGSMPFISICYQIYLLVLGFSRFPVLCFHVVFFMFILPEVHRVSWMCGLVSFISFRNSQTLSL